MEINDFNIGFLGGLNIAKSKAQLNQDIDNIQKSLKELVLKAKLDPNLAKALEAQLNNLKVGLTDVSISQDALNNMVLQVNSALKNINISGINIGNLTNIGNQAQQTGKQIGNNIAQGINSAIQKSGKFKSEYLFDGANPQNKVTETVLKDFRSLSDGIVTVREQMKNIDGKSFLDGFTVNIEHVSGQVETLTYRLKDMVDVAGNVTGKSFQYSSGSINDNGVIKQMNAISAKTDDLQIKLDKLRANYSDKNASRPIKDSSNISALSQQYDKVSQAIENVRNADNSTFTSMTFNAQKEISVLESMISQFRNAENVATQMKSTDISSGIAQASERLGKLKANSNGFEQMTQTVRDLETALSQVGDKSSLDKFINDLRVAETQLGRVKAEAKQFAEVNKIQLSIDNGTYDAKYDDLIAKTQQWSHQTDEVKKSIIELKLAYEGLKSDSTDEEKIAAAKRWEQAVKSTTNAVKQMKVEYATDSQVSAFHQKLQEFYDKNTATHRQWGASLKQMLSDTGSGAKVTNVELETMKSRLDNINNVARQTEKLGKSWFDTVKSNIKSYLPWVSMAGVIGKATQSVKQMISNVKELDTALVDLKKTAKMSASELVSFYHSANDTAKQMGVTTKQIIEQASAWSRLGFNTADAATKMAKYSSMFATISPGMDLDSATDGLVSVMKAFKIGLEDTDDVVDGIMSKINIIGNTQAVNNNDIVDFLTRSSSAMAEANNTLEDTIALGTAITEITRDAAGAGQVLKTVSMRVRGYDEETEEFVGGVEELSGKIANLTKTASTPGGISLFSDAAKTEYKSTRQLLQEISEIYDQLTDKNQANITCLYVQKCA